MKTFSLILMAGFGLLFCSCAPKHESSLIGTWESTHIGASGEVARKTKFDDSGKFKETGLIRLDDGRIHRYSASGSWILDNGTLIEKTEESDSKYGPEVGREYTVKLRFIDGNTIELIYSGDKKHNAHRIQN